VVLIVLIFKSSDALTAAYGIAVTGVMVIDTFNAGIVAGKQWRWPPAVTSACSAPWASATDLSSSPTA
jgi:KUP system potassium uptake protein